MGGDLQVIFQWWVTLGVMGVVGYPWARKLFGKWYDEGYFAAKAIGLAMTTYVVWILATVKLLAFSWVGIVVAGVLVFLAGIWVLRKGGNGDKRVKWGVIITQEIVFLLCILLWVWVKAHEPSIHGLEKFMDFGFAKSILTSKFFPPVDMWYQGGSINYYYFGHMALAVLTKLSGLDLGYTFNLILTTLFAWTATMSAGIAYQCLHRLPKNWAIGGAILTGFLVSLGGNLHTIYALTIGYDGEKPVGFWTIMTDPNGPVSLKQRTDRYWYPNATRFIPFTIHEFPAYSFVVSDIHGHVLSLPFVLLAIAFLVEIFGFGRASWPRYLAYGGLVSVLFITNASDGPIYMGLFMILLASRDPGWRVWDKDWLLERTKVAVAVMGIFVIGVMPFMANFNSFVSGLGVNCPPKALAYDPQKGSNVEVAQGEAVYDYNKYGPLVFETTEKCQKSPLWMMAILWGMGWYAGGVFLAKRKSWAVEDKMLWWAWGVMFWYCVGLVIFPEFLYFKDIYPAHFRSNTMFKLGYQAFIMWGILGGITITNLVYHKNKIAFATMIPLLVLVGIYPLFAVRSYFGIGNGANKYQTIYGMDWMKNQYPGDYAAIAWLNTQENYEIKPAIVEAVGDSYTDYARFSAFTGLPTIVGWPVHEWLWRGSYSIAAPRIEEVRKIYETPEAPEVQTILHKYNVKYIVVGNLERQKYPQIKEEEIAKFATKVFEDQGTAIYKFQ